nr:hypothetical protein BaRGS_005373 [Batillaria attramentaria]
MQPPLVSDIALIRSTLIGQNWDEVYNFCIDPIPQVRMCFQTYERKVQNLKMIAPQPTADQISLAQFCNIRLEQIDCEMGAWAQHQYQTCERVVTGMRNELECKLLPDRCMAAFPQLVTNLLIMNGETRKQAY